MITYRNQILINNNIIITGCNYKFRMPKLWLGIIQTSHHTVTFSIPFHSL